MGKDYCPSFSQVLGAEVADSSHSVSLMSNMQYRGSKQPESAQGISRLSTCLGPR